MIYFRGCTARERETTIADATEKLLKLANIDYITLDDEACCGYFLLRTGFEKEASEQIEKNKTIFENEKILTSCAGCYKTFKQDYDNIDVIHISMLLRDLINDNKISLDKIDFNVTYHDACHLARHCNEFDAPRDVIKSVANLVEMDNNKENSLCCGAGGGVKSAYPELSHEVSKARIKQAKDSGADLLITACPFRKLNLKNQGITVLDLTEFIIGDFNE